MTQISKSTELRAKESPDLELESISSVALARLVEEVRNKDEGDLASPATYNRTYNRHNR